jgi:hypothetical protein
VEKLSYMPIEEVESAFEMLNQKMLALIDLEVVAEEYRAGWDGLCFTSIVFYFDCLSDTAFICTL